MISKGWAFARTAAAPMAIPAVPANIAAKATVTFVTPISVISTQVRRPRGRALR
jgi:hypothetical protein|nr:hypothetical protein [Arthrobacter sp. Leaf337]